MQDNRLTDIRISTVHEQFEVRVRGPDGAAQTLVNALFGAGTITPTATKGPGKLIIRLGVHANFSGFTSNQLCTITTRMPPLYLHLDTFFSGFIIDFRKMQPTTHARNAGSV